MSTGGTGKLPPFGFKATGKLPPAASAKAGKSGAGQPPASAVPAALVEGTVKNITEWFSSPGEHKNPPRWLVEQVSNDILDYAKSKGAQLGPEAVQAQVRQRLKDFAREHKDQDPSEAEIQDFAESQLAELSHGLEGMKPGKMMPIV